MMLAHPAHNCPCEVQHDFLAAVWLGVFCNVLVGLAVWLSFSARTTADKILAIIPPEGVPD
jgi:formate transporter